MNERHIIFSAPMVRAILAGSKTQTRRIVKPTAAQTRYAREHLGIEPTHDAAGMAAKACLVRDDWSFCPYGVVGDRLWVRETHCPIWPQDPHYNGGKPIEMDYRATPTERMCDSMRLRKWTPAIHMRREYSRITLEIVGVRVERIQEISAKDIIAEGAVLRAHDDQFGHNPVSAFDGCVYMDLKSLWARGWDKINAKRAPWASNPFVWVIEFRRIDQ